MTKRGTLTPKALLDLQGAPPRALPPGFNVVLKPRGAVCNLDCSYCFYLAKQHLYDASATFLMSDELLESFTQHYLGVQRVPRVTFAWQGGEPTLMGLPFFQKAVAAQRRHRKPGIEVINSLQTNGLLLDEEWCGFLREYEFLVGLSIDGPRELHDAYRVDRGGKATFDRVHQALRRLQRHGVNFNVLCIVNRRNGDHPLYVYRFFKDAGVQFIQFIPAVGQSPGGGVTEWTVRGEQWGRFLCGVFGEWIRNDVGRIFVQHFDAALETWMGLEPSLCVHAKICGNCLAMEHNGDVFSCDHFVTPDYYLGNVLETPLGDLVASPFQRRFGLRKWDTLPRFCRECHVQAACNGGCPKDRFVKTPEGDPGLNYLCAGYRRFFTHIAPYMDAMVRLTRNGSPPAAIMEVLQRRQRAPGDWFGSASPGRDEVG